MWTSAGQGPVACIAPPTDSPEVLEYFGCLGCRSVMCGLCGAVAHATINPLDDIASHGGKAIPGVELKLLDDGSCSRGGRS